MSGKGSYTIAVQKKKKRKTAQGIKQIQQVGFWGKGLVLQPVI